MATTDLLKLSLFKEFRDRVGVNLMYHVSTILDDTEVTDNFAKRIYQNAPEFIDRFSRACVVVLDIAKNMSIDESEENNPVLTYSGMAKPLAADTVRDNIDIAIKDAIIEVYPKIAQ